MDDFAALINGLHGFSIALGLGIGLVSGFVFAMLTYRFYGKNFRNTFERLSDEMKNAFDGLSSEALNKNQDRFLNLANDKFSDQAERHSSELETKKELIDSQLQQMSETLKIVPTNLEKNQNKVTEVLDKSTRDLKESNQDYLNQLTEKAETQTKAHSKELEGKKELIDQKLGEMDKKLGKVEQLVQALQTDRKTQFGALGQQLKSLTDTTESLQKALADNRARGQWGERMAEDLLRFMGMVEGVNYIKQTTLDGGSRPDFTFLLPNDKTLNMDVKFPLENYTNYFDADSDVDKKRYIQLFLRDVQSRISEIQKRGYIAAETLDCVLVFIPNEQIYRFIHEQDHEIIDSALRQKVILCSPLTLYIVLAVIRQAAQNFNIERRSREIVSVVEDIRIEWDEYTKDMDTLKTHLNRARNKYDELVGKRTTNLDRKFNKIKGILESNELDESGEPQLIQLPEEAN